MLGFIISYFSFFLYPIFFNSNGVMEIPQYIPFLSPIGIDLRQVLEPTHNWVIKHNADLGFPPIAHLLFSPLLFMEHSYAYLIMVIITIMSYFFMSLISSELIS